MNRTLTPTDLASPLAAPCQGTEPSARLKAWPLLAAATGAGLLLATAGETPLPQLGWAAAFLLLSVESDLRERRIPNWLTFGGLTIALMLAFLGGGSAALANAALGVGLGLGLLFPIFALGGMGAGDVKATMVLGALFGPLLLASVLWWTTVAAGGFALVWVLGRGELLDLIRRWTGGLSNWLRTGHYVHLPARPGTASASGLPFAVALMLGVVAQQWIGGPWS